MNQDLKDYFRRSPFIQVGILFPQIIFMITGNTTLVPAMVQIAVIESLVLVGYLFLFGIKRKDGTLMRFKKIEKMMNKLTDGEC